MCMGNITLSIPGDIQSKMRHFPEIRWSEVARKAIENKVRDLETLEKLVSKSKLTQKDVEEFSKKIKASSAKRFMEE